ncbi:hypothetical protein B296_00034270 [Ensete ventricosum]|uniref:Uncharacterized protein n=1 Tax=Ensete ventricosum TaxID=4639 RepID=A0A427A904_ENSVE|nr:hypothetical protein B296_00034270 [Ensete ventricosum]
MGPSPAWCLGATQNCTVHIKDKSERILDLNAGYNTGFKEKLELNEALLSSSIELQRILAALQTTFLVIPDLQVLEHSGRDSPSGDVADKSVPFNSSKRALEKATQIMASTWWGRTNACPCSHPYPKQLPLPPHSLPLCKSREPKPRDPRGLPAKESCRGPRRQLSYRVGSLAHITRSALSAINTALYLSSCPTRLPLESSPRGYNGGLRSQIPRDLPRRCGLPRLRSGRRRCSGPQPHLRGWRPLPVARRRRARLLGRRPLRFPPPLSVLRLQPGVSCIDAFRDFVGEGFGSPLGLFS